MRGSVRAAFFAALLLSEVTLAPRMAAGTPGSTRAFPQEVGAVSRLEGASPNEVGLEISRRRFANGGAKWVILASEDQFADALAGSPLTSDGPMFFIPSTELPKIVEEEIRRVLPSDDDDRPTVYLLGNRIDKTIESDLRYDGFEAVRLAGPSRIETSVAVADEVRLLYPAGPRQVVLARAFGPQDNPTAAWADSLAGGTFAAARRIPILLTTSESVHPAVDAALEDQDVTFVAALGGPSALAEPALESIRSRAREVVRYSGPSRAATAVQLMRAWDPSPYSELPTTFTAVPGYDEDSWQYGLVAAGYSAVQNRPVLLVGRSSVDDYTLAAVNDACRRDAPSVMIIGSRSVVSDSVESRLEASAAC